MNPSRLTFNPSKEKLMNPFRRALSISAVAAVGIVGLSVPAQAHTMVSRAPASLVSDSTTLGANQRAQATLQLAIDTVATLNVSDEVKAMIVDALTQAIQNLANGGSASMADAPAEVRQELDRIKAARFASLMTRMLALADRVQAAINELAAGGGNENLVASASALLTDARARLTAATSSSDLRSVWRSLREIRRSLAVSPTPTTTAPVAIAQ